MHSSLIHVNIRRPLRPISIWLLFCPPVAAAFCPRVVSSFASPPAVSSSATPEVSPAPETSPFGIMSSIGTSGDEGVSMPPKKWSDIFTITNRIYRNYANNLFPPLTDSAHKGSHGRVAIFGGSEKYTGAPYYAAQSALHCGIDLATVFCAKEASVPIKCYSPELMVQSVYSVEELDDLLKQEESLLEELEQCKQKDDLMTNDENRAELLQTMENLEHSEEKQNLLIQNELKNDDKMELLAERLAKMKQLEGRLQELRERQDASVGNIVNTITSMLPTLHTLCIGPGLGRHPLVFSAVEKVIHEAIELDLALVLDADVLFMLSLDKFRSLLDKLRSYDRCVMTPNQMEMRRLNDAFSEGLTDNIVVQKGNLDKIIQGCHTMLCDEEGGLKRSGGIGDVLAGTLTAFMAWNAILERDKSKNLVLVKAQQRRFAAWTACCAVKRATKAAFQEKKRAMSAVDVIREMGEVLTDMEVGLKSELGNHMELQTTLQE